MPGYEYDLTSEFDIVSLLSQQDDDNSMEAGGSERNKKKTIGGGISTHSVDTSSSSSSSPRRGLRNNKSSIIHNNNNSKKQQSPILSSGPLTYSVESLFIHSLRKYQMVLGIDKQSFIQRGILFPPTSVPDRGPNGHMALMDCIFNALATNPPESSGLMDDAVAAAGALRMCGSWRRR